jgi:hypothetical protein
MGKNVCRLHLNGKKTGCGGVPVMPVRLGSINRRITVKAGLGGKARPYFQNNESEKSCMCDSSSGVHPCKHKA